jgi:DUF4097 and DUF4098 domain-containing protein YvlB
MRMLTMFAGVMLGISLLGNPGVARPQKVHDKEDIKRTLAFSPSAATRKLVVDNIDGPIMVSGYDGNAVELVIHKTITAESDEKVKEAKEKVTVQITEEPDRIVLYVDAPWRCKDGSVHNRGPEYYGYEVSCDFEIRVPVKTDIVLKTMNDGDIEVSSVEGSYDVENLNGAVEMTSIRGAGKATTLNGDVKVAFTGNPGMPCTFKTLNGEVEVRFKDGLSADLDLKTMNGEVFTDFPVKGLPPKTAEMEVRHKKKIYRSGDSFSVRVGSGGPALAFETMNGNIYIVKNDQQ